MGSARAQLSEANRLKSCREDVSRRYYAGAGLIIDFGILADPALGSREGRRGTTGYKQVVVVDVRTMYCICIIIGTDYTLVFTNIIPSYFARMHKMHNNITLLAAFI